MKGRMGSEEMEEGGRRLMLTLNCNGGRGFPELFLFPQSWIRLN